MKVCEKDKIGVIQNKNNLGYWWKKWRKGKIQKKYEKVYSSYNFLSGVFDPIIGIKMKIQKDYSK